MKLSDMRTSQMETRRGTSKLTKKYSLAAGDRNQAENPDAMLAGSVCQWLEEKVAGPSWEAVESEEEERCLVVTKDVC